MNTKGPRTPKQRPIPHPIATGQPSAPHSLIDAFSFSQGDKLLGARKLSLKKTPTSPISPDGTTRLSKVFSRDHQELKGHRRVGRFATRIKRQFKGESGEGSQTEGSDEVDSTDCDLSDRSGPETGDGASPQPSPVRLESHTFFSRDTSDRRHGVSDGRTMRFRQKTKNKSRGGKRNNDPSADKPPVDPEDSMNGTRASAGYMIPRAPSISSSICSPSRPAHRKEMSKDPTFLFAELSKQFTFSRLVAFRILQDRVMYLPLGGEREMLSVWMMGDSENVFPTENALDSTEDERSPLSGGSDDSRRALEAVVKSDDEAFSHYEYAEQVVAINLANIFGHETSAKRMDMTGIARFADGDTFQLVTSRGLHIYQAQHASQKRSFLNRIRFATFLPKNRALLYGKEKTVDATQTFETTSGDLLRQLNIVCKRHETNFEKMKQHVSDKLDALSRSTLRQNTSEVDQAEYLESFQFTYTRNAQDISDEMVVLQKDAKSSTERLKSVEHRIRGMRDKITSGKQRLDALEQNLDELQLTRWNTRWFSQKTIIVAGSALLVLISAIEVRQFVQTSARTEEGLAIPRAIASPLQTSIPSSVKNETVMSS